MVGAAESGLSVKILMVTGSFPPMKCGVGDYSFSLVKSLTQYKDIHIGVLTSESAARSTESSKVDVFPIISKWSFSEIFKVLNLVRRWRPGIIHIQYPTQGYGRGLLPAVLPLVGFFCGLKVVQTWHEGYSGRRNIIELVLKSFIPGALVVVRPNYIEKVHPWFRWMFSEKSFIFIENASSIPRVVLDLEEKRMLRETYLRGQKRLIVFFGFLHFQKGVDLVFDVANPDIDHLVIIGEADSNTDYEKLILNSANVAAWRGKVTLTGFLPAADVARMLAVADAVVLPFRVGGGEWNTSIHGAVLNGAFVLTTSLSKNGYDSKRNQYCAKVNDVEEMKAALQQYAGARRRQDETIDRDEWLTISEKHRSLYTCLFNKKKYPRSAETQK